MKEFDLSLLVKIISKNIITIVLAALVAGSGTFFFLKYVANPVFTASGSLLVTNGTIINEGAYTSSDKKLENADIVTSLNFANTVVDILNTPGIYKRLAGEFNNSYSYRQLMSMINIHKRSEDSLFIDVRFTASDPESAKNLVNSFLALVPDYIGEYVPNTASAITLSDGADSAGSKIVVKSFAGAVVGAVIVCAIALFLSMYNTLIRDGEDYKERFPEVPLIGVIPDFNSARSKDYKYYKYSKYGYYGYKGYGKYGSYGSYGGYGGYGSYGGKK